MQDTRCANSYRCNAAIIDADAEMEGEESELVSTSGCGLAGNLDVLTCRADWLYHSGAHQVISLSFLRFCST